MSHYLLLIECKTAGKEFDKAWKETLDDGGQLFSYAQQISATEFLCLYASDFDKKNKQLSDSQRIISHKDNEEILKQQQTDKPQQSFNNASNLLKRYQVWKNIYQLEYTETGIFEDNIQAYQIGKDKYTLEYDTKPLTAIDKKGKYHQFRNILRKHNIARKETAFEVLVNLFLCKIVDEQENPNDLKLYWKGIAYDNYYDFVDRLQELYKIGMSKFLNEDITYISNQQINDAFWTVKNDRNATKKTIQKYFRELKFFSNNAFSFINVHNERLFNKNVKVLVEVAALWQKLRLKTDEQNQFLGDMFEYFLDNSIKQSEGQFFTPMPICKFIVSSLPLDHKVEHTKEALKTIDYACGAGHFLNEYAHQVKPLVIKHKDVDISEYYKQTVGIEKEDRLAKVAKVSAFMYGQDDIQILDRDALEDIDTVKQDSFDILVANPPFAVKDFLSTLDESIQNKYELINTTGINSATNNIQCFFIERAKQLLAPNAVAGIVVPSSVLSNSDSTHIGTREIILKYFDIVSLVELGGSTFGKTGTNTIVLFLRRKSQTPAPAEHYLNRTIAFFEGVDTENDALKVHDDLYLIEQYCTHIAVAFEDYKTLLNAPNNAYDVSSLMTYDIFEDYKTDFDKSTVTKKLLEKHTKAIKAVEKEGKKVGAKLQFTKAQLLKKHEQELNQKFVEHIRTIEQDKLYYFILAATNPQQVLIVKSPTKNADQKKFLGYEWSGAKGSEGIKYYGGDTVHDIITPMFDPKNINNPEKVNYYIAQNFIGKTHTILPENCSYTNVADLLDFSRKDFNKTFSLSILKKTAIQTQWDTVKLKDHVKTLNGLWKGKKEPFTKATVIRNTNFTKNGKLNLDDVAILDVEISQFKKRKLEFGDIIIEKSGGSATQAIGRVVLFDKKTGDYSYSNFTSRIRLISDKFSPQFLHLFLHYYYTLGYTFDLQNGVGGIKNLDFEKYLDSKIPLPPLKVQQQIVKACEAVDKAVENAQAEVKALKASIEKQFSVIQKKGIQKKLGDICTLKAGVFVKASDIYQEKNKNLFPCYGGNGLRGFTKSFTHEGKFPLVGRQGALCGNVHLVNGIFHATEHALVAVPQKDIDPDWLFFLLRSMQLNQYATGVAQPGLSVKNITPLRIPVPSLKDQKGLIIEIKALEAQIKSAQAIITTAEAQKQAVMEKYL